MAPNDVCDRSTYLNADCVEPISTSAASYMLLRMMKDRVFLNTRIMQIGQVFGLWCFFVVCVWVLVMLWSAYFQSFSVIPSLFCHFPFLSFFLLHFELLQYLYFIQNFLERLDVLDEWVRHLKCFFLEVIFNVFYLTSYFARAFLFQKLDSSKNLHVIKASFNFQ